MTPTDPQIDAIEQRLAAAGEFDVEPDWQRLTAALAERAAAEGLVDVAVERHDSAIGPLMLAATHEGVVRVGFPEEEDGFLDELAQRISGRVLRVRRTCMTEARHELDEYFAHDRTAFDVALDWRLTHGFRREVLTVTAAIPYGQTLSYAQVAAEAGSPRAWRAAGTALATNPLPILVPCHRVVRTTGVIGPYRGGTEVKRRLLSLEAGEGQGA
jgi:methylated-DNA-[protein]-cysteine S-methyltransferase